MPRPALGISIGVAALTRDVIVSTSALDGQIFRETMSARKPPPKWRRRPPAVSCPEAWAPPPTSWSVQEVGTNLDRGVNPLAAHRALGDRTRRQIHPFLRPGTREGQGNQPVGPATRASKSCHRSILSIPANHRLFAAGHS
jgi:hypothetical protein